MNNEHYKPKYRYVTLPNGKKRRMTENQIASLAGLLNDPIMQGGTVSIGFWYEMQAAKARASELEIDPVSPEWVTL